MKDKVLLDIDGVLADFFKAFAKHLNETLGTNIDPNIEPSDYNIGNWSTGIDPVQISEIIRNWLASGGYSTIPIYDGAKQFVYQLMDKYDVFVVTARIGDFRMGLTEEIKSIIKQNTRDWFKGHGIPANKIFFEHQKINFCKANKITVMIEDKLDTVRKAADKGLKAILIDRGYNRDPEQRNHPNIIIANNYEEILQALEQLLP